MFHTNYRANKMQSSHLPANLYYGPLRVQPDQLGEYPRLATDVVLEGAGQLNVHQFLLLRLPAALRIGLFLLRSRMRRAPLGGGGGL